MQLKDSTEKYLGSQQAYKKAYKQHKLNHFKSYIQYIFKSF